jgi:predicted DNA-binding protein
LVSIYFEKDLEKRLDNLSKTTKRSKSYYIKAALTKYLDKNEAHLLDLYQKELGGSKNPKGQSVEEVDDAS